MGRFLLSLLAILLIVAAVLAAAFVLYYQPQTKELEDARREASLMAHERADLNSRVADLEHLLDEVRAESEELEAEVQAKEAVLAELQSTQDELVAELEQEIADGQIQVQRLRGQLRVDMVDEILFDSGQATLKPEGQAVLEKVASVLANANRVIQVQGHTDNVPIEGRLAERFPTNWELSAAPRRQRRSLSSGNGKSGPNDAVRQRALGVPPAREQRHRLGTPKEPPHRDSARATLRAGARLVGKPLDQNNGCVVIQGTAPCVVSPSVHDPVEHFRRARVACRLQRFGQTLDAPFVVARVQHFVHPVAENEEPV